MPVRSGGKRDKPSGGGASGEFIDFYRTEKRRRACRGRENRFCTHMVQVQLNKSRVMCRVCDAGCRECDPPQ